MGLFRLLILLALLFAAWTLWRRFQRWQTGRAAPRNSEAPPRMVRCAHCRLHLPAEQALQQGNDWYCCPEHRDADQ